MSVVADPCGLLGVAPGSTEKEINAAYRRASLKCHPDRCPGDPQAAAKFAQLAEAKDTLVRQAQAIASCFPSHVRAEQLKPQPNQASFYFSNGFSPASASTASASSATSAAFSCFGSSAAPAAAAPQDDMWSQLQAKARTQAHEEAERQAAEQRRRRASVNAAQAVVQEPPRTASSPSAPPSKKLRAAAGAGQEELSGRGTSKASPKAAVRDAARPLVTPARGSKAAGRGMNTTAAQKAKPKPGPTKAKSEPGASKRKRKTRAEQETVEEEPEAEAEEVEDEDVEDADDDDGQEEEDEEADDDEEEEQDDEPPLVSRRLLLHGDDPLGWIESLLIAGPCEDPDAGQEVRDMLAEMWSHVCVEARKQPALPLHTYHLRAAHMVSEALSRYRKSLAGQVEDACKVSSAAMADEDGKTAELVGATGTAKAAREAKLTEVSEADAQLIANKETLTRTRSMMSGAVEEAAKVSAAEKSTATTRNSAQQAIEHFEKLESAGPPAKPAELKQAIKEIEGLLAKASASDQLMSSVLKRVIPALKMKPDSRERFDEAALSAVEGCLRAHVKEKADEAAVAERSAIAARGRAKRLQEEADDAKRRVDEAATLLKQDKEALRALTSTLKQASEASRQHAAHVRALSLEAKACKEALKETDQACSAIEALINRAAA